MIDKFGPGSWSWVAACWSRSPWVNQIGPRLAHSAYVGAAIGGIGAGVIYGRVRVGNACEVVPDRALGLACSRIDAAGRRRIGLTVITMPK